MGNRYESEMLGTHPSGKKPHINYEADMKGTRPSSKVKMAEGGKMKKGRTKACAEGGRMNMGGKASYAMGGSGKIRHKEMTDGGMPIKKRKSLSK